MGGREGKAIAVRCGGRGDVTATHTVWEKPLQAGIGTPVVEDGYLFWNARGIAICASCETGEEVYKARLSAGAEPGDAGGNRRRAPAGDYASPVVMNDKVVMLMRDGTAFVLSAKKEFDKVAENNFPGDTSLFNSTPAIADNQLFVRSNNKLYCIQE
jgi:hypothetical protein